MADFAQIPVLDIKGHLVPVFAYLEITRNWRKGFTGQWIIEDVMKSMPSRFVEAVGDVVLTAIQDQNRLLEDYNKSSTVNLRAMMQLPLDAPEAVWFAKRALQEARNSLREAESIQKGNALEAPKLIESYQSYHNHSSRRRTYANLPKREASKKERTAENKIRQLRDEVALRERLLAVATCPPLATTR